MSAAPEFARLAQSRTNCRKKASTRMVLNSALHLPGFQAREDEQVLHEGVEPVRVALHRFEDALRFLAGHVRVVRERLQVTAKNGQRRAEFVGNIGHEILPDDLQLLDAGDVVEDDHRPAHLVLFGADRHHADVEMTRGKPRRGAFQDHLLLARLAPPNRLVDDHLDPGFAQRFQHRAAQRALLQVKEIEQLVVHQPHHVPLIDHHHAFHHVGQKNVQVEVLLPLLALQLFQTRPHAFQMA